MQFPNDKSPVSTLWKWVIGSVAVSVILTFVGLIADVTQIVTSSWFEGLMTSNAIRWAPYIANVILLAFVIHIYRKSKSEQAKMNSSLEFAYRVNQSLWIKYVRTLRSIMLEDITKPSVRDTLEPLLNELAKRLPENGVEFKIAIAKPFLDGRFKILAERGMDPTSVHSIEAKSNWKEQKSLFANGLYLSGEKPYSKYKAGGNHYENIQRPQGTGSSVSHFIIVLSDPVYPEAEFPRNALCVLSIGIPQSHDFNDTEEALFYGRIFPVIKSIESMLLSRKRLDGNLGSN